MKPKLEFPRAGEEVSYAPEKEVQYLWTLGSQRYICVLSFEQHLKGDNGMFGITGNDSVRQLDTVTLMLKPRVLGGQVPLIVSTPTYASFHR